MIISRRLQLELWIAAAVVALDQASKALIRSRFDLHESLEIIPGFFNLMAALGGRYVPRFLTLPIIRALQSPR